MIFLKCDLISFFSHILPDVVVTVAVAILAVVLVLGLADSHCSLGPDRMLQSLSPVSRMEQVCELWLNENIWPPYTGPSSCRNS